MAKVIRQSHITGEAGVIKFSEYCNSHKPYIVFSEVTKNDFGMACRVLVLNKPSYSGHIANTNAGDNVSKKFS